MTDEELVRQPAGYWTGVAYEALISFIRARHAELGYTQPQFWLLRNLSANDISSDGDGMTIAQLQEAMNSYIRPEDDLEREAAALVARHLLRRDDDGRLWITEDGEDARVEIGRHAPTVRDRLHAGIDDRDYVTTLKVLRQFIENAGGSID